MLDAERAIVAAYEAGASCHAVGREHGLAGSTVLAIVRRRGGRVRSASEAQRRYACDETFFDRIDSEEKAYWLGFITADGCVTDRNRLTFCLAIEDGGQLEKFRAALGSSHRVFEYRTTTRVPTGGRVPSVTARFNLRSDRICGALRRLGVAERKSAEVEPARIPAGLVRHYWRGIFDGDGAIWYEPPRRRWGLSLCGSLSIVSAFADWARPRCGSATSVLPRPGMYRYSLGSAKAVLVMRALYEGASVSLERKRVLYESALARGHVEHFRCSPPPG